MRDFFKYVFASAIGFILGSFLLFGLLMVLLTAAITTLSSESEVDVADGSVLQLRLDQPFSERTSKNPFRNLDFSNLGTTNTLGLTDIIKNIEKAKRDPHIKGILLDLSTVPAGMASMEAIRSSLNDFKKSGKFIYSYGEYYSQGAYYLATVSNRIYLHPQGAIDFKGLHAELMFFKGALDKLEIEPQIIRHGKFKSAIEPFILDKMSSENREQMQVMMDGLWNHLVQQISTSRAIPVDSLHAMANAFDGRNPETALTKKLVDRVAYYDELLADLQQACNWKKDEKPKMIAVNKYDKSSVKSDRPFSNKKIAVIYAVGEIGEGEGSDEKIGSATTAGEIRKARLDTSIKAIVLRVNSPGGSALASDVIWREIMLAKKAKPVVASMGDYAASGGYYIACAADSIVAEPTTITGSIGVFGLLFNAQKMFNNKLGITFDTVKTSHFADIGSMSRPMRDDERAMIQREIEHVYDVFISHVADGRRMSKANVDSIGQGRVWTGTDAVRLGLVDRIGTLQDAIEVAAKLARLDNYRTIELPRQKELLEELMQDLNVEAVTYFAKKELGENYRYYSEFKKLINEQGIMARMPYYADIR